MAKGVGIFLGAIGLFFSVLGLASAPAKPGAIEQEVPLPAFKIRLGDGRSGMARLTSTSAGYVLYLGNESGGAHEERIEIRQKDIVRELGSFLSEIKGEAGGGTAWLGLGRRGRNPERLDEVQLNLSPRFPGERLHLEFSTLRGQFRHGGIPDEFRRGPEHREYTLDQVRNSLQVRPAGSSPVTVLMPSYGAYVSNRGWTIGFIAPNAPPAEGYRLQFEAPNGKLYTVPLAGKVSTEKGVVDAVSPALRWQKSGTTNPQFIIEGDPASPFNVELMTGPWAPLPIYRDPAQDEEVDKNMHALISGGPTERYHAVEALKKLSGQGVGLIASLLPRIRSTRDEDPADHNERLDDLKELLAYLLTQSPSENQAALLEEGRSLNRYNSSDAQRFLDSLLARVASATETKPGGCGPALESIR